MKKLSVFNFVTVDGFFAGPHGEIDWFKFIKKDAEYEEFSHKNAGTGNGTLMFGNTTYQMMKSFWPTEAAIKSDPGMAQAMNSSQKIVFSKTAKDGTSEETDVWKHVTYMNGINAEEIMKLKEQAGSDITILGSGSVVQQLANLDLIDEYTLIIVPIVLGEGKALFKDVKKTNLELVDSRSFKNGVMWLRYKVENK